MPDWNPEQYRRFAEERAQPFHDLLALIEPGVDRACRRSRVRPRGVDRVGRRAARRRRDDRNRQLAGMLDKTGEHASDGVRFEFGDIGEWTSSATSISCLPRPVCSGFLTTSTSWRAGPRLFGRAGRSRFRCRPTPTCRRTPSPVALPNASRTVSLFGPEGPPIDPVQAYVLRAGGVRPDLLRPWLRAAARSAAGLSARLAKHPPRRRVGPRHDTDPIREAARPRRLRGLRRRLREGVAARARRPRAPLLPLPTNPHVGAGFRSSRLESSAPRFRRSGGATLRRLRATGRCRGRSGSRRSREVSVCRLATALLDDRSVDRSGVLDTRLQRVGRVAGADEAATVGELDEQCLVARRVPGRRDQAQAGRQVELSS